MLFIDATPGGREVHIWTSDDSAFSRKVYEIPENNKVMVEVAESLALIQRLALKECQSDILAIKAESIRTGKYTRNDIYWVIVEDSGQNIVVSVQPEEQSSLLQLLHPALLELGIIAEWVLKIHRLTLVGG